MDKNIKVIKTNRGGKHTLHSPGQKIVYFVLNLNKRKKDIRFLVKNIEMVPLLYHMNYVRKDAEEIIKKEYNWINTGAHYFDDLYQSLMSYILRKKFKLKMGQTLEWKNRNSL